MGLEKRRINKHSQWKVTRALIEICLPCHGGIGKKWADSQQVGSGFPEKVTWELGFRVEFSCWEKVEKRAPSRCLLLKVRGMMVMSALCARKWEKVKLEKEGWEQIPRFLRHPKDCGLFPTSHLYSWIVFTCRSSF